MAEPLNPVELSHLRYSSDPVVARLLATISARDVENVRLRAEVERLRNLLDPEGDSVRNAHEVQCRRGWWAVRCYDTEQWIVPGYCINPDVLATTDYLKSRKALSQPTPAEALLAADAWLRGRNL